MIERKFSVSMCVYYKDNPEWFDTALESVLNQTIKPTEIVLVVDGPVTEKLEAIIKKYELRKDFNVIRLEKNQGHGNARRIGLKACKNELVALMDADDICVANRFEKQLEMFQKNPMLSVVGGDISEFIREPSNIVAYRRVYKEDDEIKQDIRKRCPFNQMTVMFKKSIYEQAGGYIDWYCNEDYYLWIRMMQHGAVFGNIGCTLVNVRVGDEMYKRRGGCKYFASEAKLQKYMLDHKIINIPTYILNVCKRLVVQILLPNKIRGWIFKKFAREQI